MWSGLHYLFSVLVKAGVHVKAVLTSPYHVLSGNISVTFQTLLISLTTVERFYVNFWMIFGNCGNEIFFLEGRLY